jgi:hypothetical protein
MRIDVLTLFPQVFESPLSSSILKRAQDNGLLDITLTDIRDFSTGSYNKVDDKPYGGGPGMVMMPGPVFDCFEHVRKLSPEEGRPILLTPQGQKFDQAKALELSAEKRLILIAGKYEGFDERIRTGLGAEQISIGDYVLSGGPIVGQRARRRRLGKRRFVQRRPSGIPALHKTRSLSRHECTRNPPERRPRQNSRMAPPAIPRKNKKMAPGFTQG